MTKISILIVLIASLAAETFVDATMKCVKVSQYKKMKEAQAAAAAGIETTTTRAPIKGFKLSFMQSLFRPPAPAPTQAPTSAPTFPPPPPPVQQQPLYPPCGTFEPFDTVNGLNQLRIKGFSAGTFEDGTEAYVGYGNNSECFNEFYAPGRLTDNALTPGGFFGCTRSLDLTLEKIINYQSNGNYFLRQHPDLRWVKTDRVELKNVKNVLEIKSSYRFNFGRFVAANGKVYVGKVMPTYKGFYFTTTDDELLRTYDFEVLTCVNGAASWPPN